MIFSKKKESILCINRKAIIIYNHFHLQMAISFIKEYNLHQDNKIPIDLMILDTNTMHYKLEDNPMINEYQWDNIFIIDSFEKLSRNIVKAYLSNNRRKKKIKNILNINKYKEIFTFIDHEVTSQYIIDYSKLKYKSKFILIEEGLAIYNSIRNFKFESDIKNRINEFILKLFYFRRYKRINLGFNSNIDVLYVQYPQLLDEKIIKNKNIFKINNQIFNKMWKTIRLCETNSIFVTQPMSENGFMQYNVELKIVNKILKYIYKSGIICTLKLHPVEQIDKYNKVGTPIKLIDEKFNIEELLANSNVNNVFTFFSSSAINALNFSHIKHIIFLYRLINDEDLNSNDQFVSVYRMIENISIVDKRIKIPHSFEELEEILMEINYEI